MPVIVTKSRVEPLGTWRRQARAPCRPGSLWGPLPGGGGPYPPLLSMGCSATLAQNSGGRPGRTPSRRRPGQARSVAAGARSEVARSRFASAALLPEPQPPTGHQEPGRGHSTKTPQNRQGPQKRGAAERVWQPGGASRDVTPAPSPWALQRRERVR